MKQLGKVLIWIIILGAILFGVYAFVPEYPHNFMKSFVQPVVDARAKELITSVQNLTNSDVNNATYKEILEKHTSMRYWVYETRETEPGVEYVIFGGKGASINLKDYTDYDGLLSTSAFVKFEFKITGNNVDIYPYIDGKPMHINDARHAETNKKIRLDILSQLYGGFRED